MIKKARVVPVLVLRLMLCVVFVIAAACSEQAEPEPKDTIRPVRAVRVGDVEPLISRSFPGRAEAAREVNLPFRVSGPLVSLPVDVGDVVERGDLVARIDPRDFETDVRNAEGSLSRAKANLKQAQSELQRNLNIQSENAGAIAQATIDESREEVAVAESDITALEASLQEAKDALKDTRLLAPFPGQVVATYIDNFETVQAGSPVIRLLDNTQIEFVINIPEALVGVATDVTNIRVVFDAYPDLEIPARISEVGTEASETTRTYPITLVMDQPKDVAILPGMAGRASADPIRDGETLASDIVVPITALASEPDGNRSAVWVIDPESNKVAPRDVTVLSLSNTGYIISEGLERGEIVVTAGVSFLREGQVVKPQLQQ
ncbi:MAG: efflux RND transporter periplasmic adaptor subunit [Planctomycetota bacterium]